MADNYNMRAVIDHFPKQLNEALLLGDNIKIEDSFERIIVTGMGGSGHAGDLLAAYAKHLNLNIPVHVVREYRLPSFINSKTLVFAISYSGNTEETLSSFEEARKKEAKIIAITSGGRLKELAEKNNIQAITVPQGLSPRLSIGYLFIPILTSLERAGIINGTKSEIKNAINFIESTDITKTAEDIALKLKGKVPLIYTSTNLGIVGYIWKILLNECAKTPAFSHVIPEMNHNEINAFKNLTAKCFALFIDDEADHPLIRKRTIATRNIVSESVETLHILLKGASFLPKTFKAIHIAMYVSYFLALIYNTDPTPVPVIENLKRTLALNV